MRKHAYEVVFVDGSSVEEWAFNAAQAKILAQAARIQRGEAYDVKEVKYVGVIPF